MTPPTGLTFFVEVAAAELDALLSETTLKLLAQAQASLAVAMIDLLPERAVALRRAASYGIGVTAWLVLDRCDGYWLTIDNAESAGRRWQQVQAWLTHESVQVQAVGLDIEMPEADAVALSRAPLPSLWRLWTRRRRRHEVALAKGAYLALIEQVRGAGWPVETYQLPFVIDERAARSTLLQRVLGFADVRGDREVLMLYRSVPPAGLGRWMVELWGAEAEAIAVGITGGGVASLQPVFANRQLHLQALRDELARARHFGRPLYVFSLEGCVQGEMLEELLQQPLPKLPRLGPPAWLWLGRQLAGALLRLDVVWGRLGRRD